MRSISILISVFLILISCTKFGKNVYVDGRVYNPITGEGIPNIPVRLYRNTIDSKDPLGVGSKTLETTTTDANGYYKVEHLSTPFNKVWIRLNNLDYYPIGWVDYGNTGEAGIKKGKKNHLDYQMVPYGQTYQIFKRKKFGIPSVHHEINVTQMREIDNTAGSYLAGFGNIISVANWTYFTLLNWFDGRDYFSHKSVVTALGIDKNLWPSNGNMTMDMKGLKLMFNRFGLDYNSNNYSLQSNHYGYPNLGRPNDHFQVTPFEAIYVDNQIDPHIELKDAEPAYVDSLNNFILNEAEPWYLGLQNQVVGSRARLNYSYYVRRRARNIITVGHLVTPTTDPGDYVTLENVEVDLRAGQEINLKPGVYFQSGSTVHLKIEFEECLQNRLDQGSSGMEENQDSQGEMRLKEPEERISKEKQAHLYPNPSNDGTFVLQVGDGKVISGIRIFTTFGTLVDDVRENQTTAYKYNKPLQTGTYIIQVLIENQVEIHKLVVL